MTSQPVWGHLVGAKTMLGFADAETKDLDRFTYRLGTPAAQRRDRDDVWRTYLSWLTFSRQVAVSVHKAGNAAGQPAEFKTWWTGLNGDPVHAFVRNERNAALKQVVGVVEAKPIDVGEDQLLVFWAFPHGPHAGEPMVPRCQQYINWLYDSLWTPACELLYPWTLEERRATPRRRADLTTNLW